MPWYLWFLAGLLVGTVCGYMLLALALAARDGDR